MISTVLEMSRQFIDSFTRASLNLRPATDSVLEKKDTIIELSERQHSLLEGIVRRTKAAQGLVIRAKIILYLWLGYNVSETAHMLGIVRKTVRKWRERWNKEIDRLKEFEGDKQCTDKKLSTLIKNILSDAYRSGTPPKYTAEQVVQIIALACQDIEKYGLPLNYWTSKALSEEAIRRGIVKIYHLAQ